jgi:hypothetical protein
VLNAINEGRIQRLKEIERPDFGLRIYKELTHHYQNESGLLLFSSASDSTV